MPDLQEEAYDITLKDMFLRSFQIYRDNVAVSWEDGEMTYQELEERSCSLANALVKRGLKKGDRVAVISETRSEFVVSYIALAAIGVVAVTFNIRLRDEELAQLVCETKCVGILASEKVAARIGDKLSSKLLVKASLGPDVDGWESWAVLSVARNKSEALEWPEIVVHGTDIHNVLFTSGTTDKAKGAMISQRAAAMRAHRLASWFNLDSTDGFVGWAPLFHCGGDESLYATLMTGGTFCALRTTDIDTMMRVIDRDRLTWLLLLPGVLNPFFEYENAKNYDLNCLRWAVCYANMSPETIRQLMEKYRIRVSDAFGQTESSYLLAHGVCLPGEMPDLKKWPAPLLNIRVVDDAMKDVPAGGVGECIVRGPTVMSGYLDNLNATKEVFRDGWLHTGDLLRRNKDGSVSFMGRKKYLIKSGGENILPEEIELVISRLPGVEEVAVFGVPDDNWGEAVKAAVVLRPGATLGTAEILAECKRKLASYKRPRYIEFFNAEEMPRSTTGKLQRNRLAALPVGDPV